VPDCCRRVIGALAWGQAGTVSDVGDFEAIDIFPSPLCCWRFSNECIARHRNPNFSRELGITPSKSLTVDVLHCISLGVLLVWCRHVVWMLIVSHVWTAAGTLEEVQDFLHWLSGMT
jgi:hypothetical protein